MCDDTVMLKHNYISQIW